MGFFWLIVPTLCCWEDVVLVLHGRHDGLADARSVTFSSTSLTVCASVTIEGNALFLCELIFGVSVSPD